jgi:hypothetical protein
MADIHDPNAWMLFLFSAAGKSLGGGRALRTRPVEPNGATTVCVSFEVQAHTAGTWNHVTVIHAPPHTVAVVETFERLKLRNPDLVDVLAVGQTLVMDFVFGVEVRAVSLREPKVP